MLCWHLRIGSDPQLCQCCHAAKNSHLLVLQLPCFFPQDWTSYVLWLLLMPVLYIAIAGWSQVISSLLIFFFFKVQVGYYQKSSSKAAKRQILRDSSGNFAKSSLGRGKTRSCNFQNQKCQLLLTVRLWKSGRHGHRCSDLVVHWNKKSQLGAESSGVRDSCRVLPWGKMYMLLWWDMK